MTTTKQMLKHHGLWFEVVARFPDTEAGTNDANTYMLTNEDVGVLAVSDGQINLVRLADMGTDQLVWSELWAAMDAYPTEWIPTTAGMYWQMLECLPPRAQRGGRFLVGEPKTHINGEAVHACFCERDGGYFAKHMTVREFRELV